MDFDDTPEEAEFRTGARAFLDKNATKRAPGAGMVYRAGNESPEFRQRAKDWQAKKADAGYAGITWAKEWGGRGGSAIQQVIYDQEEAKYNVPRGLFDIGLGMCIPTLFAYATEEQRRRYAPAALSSASRRPCRRSTARSNNSCFRACTAIHASCASCGRPRGSSPTCSGISWKRPPTCRRNGRTPSMPAGTLVRVEPGSAVDCCGHDILVPEEEMLDLLSYKKVAELAKEDPRRIHTLGICVRYVECPTENVPVLYDDCGCDDNGCAPNRILESYAFDVTVDPTLTTLPRVQPAELASVIFARAAEASREPICSRSSCRDHDVDSDERWARHACFAR